MTQVDVAPTFDHPNLYWRK